MKIKYIFQTILLLLCLTSVSLGQIPDEIKNIDTNGIITEMNVSFTSQKTDQLFYIMLPYSFQYSESIDSMRVYDSDYNQVSFHVWENNLEGYIVSIKDTVTQGNNTYYFTLGDDELQNVQNTSIYKDFYDLNIVQNKTFGSSNNVVFLKLNKFMTPAHNINITFVNGTTNTTRIWINGSNDNQPFLVYNSQNTNVFNETTIRANDRRFSSVIIYDNTNTSLWISNLRNLNNTSIASNVSYNETNFNATPVANTYINQVNIICNNSTQIIEPNQYLFSLAQGNYTQCNQVLVDSYLKDNFFILYFYNSVNKDSIGGVFTPFNFYWGDKHVSQDSYYTYTRYDTNVSRNVTQNFNKYNASWRGSDLVETFNNVTVNGEYLFNTSNYTLLSRIQWSFIYKDVDTIEILSTSDKIQQMQFDQSLYKTGYMSYQPSQDSVYYNASNTYYGTMIQFVENGTRKPIENVYVTSLQTYSGYQQSNTSSANQGSVFFASLTTNEEYYLQYSGLGIENGSTYIYGSGRTNTINWNFVEVNRIYNINIKVVDADTNQPISAFTTFFGENQSIRSTDNGSVNYRNVAGGQQEVIIQVDGYNQVTRGVFISEDNQTFTLKVSKISSGDNEIITPLYVTMKVFNQAQNQLYGFTAIIKDDNGNEVFNSTMNSTSQFTVQLDRTKIYTIQIIKAQTQVNQTFTVHGLNDGDQVTLIVKEVIPQQQPTVEQVISYNTTVTEDSQYAYIRVVYTSSIGGYPTNSGGTPRLNYIMRESGERGVIEPVSYNTINNTTYIVNYRIPLQTYSDMYENTTTFTYNQSFVINGISGEGTVQYKYVLSQGGQHLIDLGLSQEQYEIIAYACIFLITLSMATASNIPFTVQSTVLSTLFFMWLRWLTPHPFVVQLLAIGLIIALIEIYRRNKTSN